MSRAADRALFLLSLAASSLGCASAPLVHAVRSGRLEPLRALRDGSDELDRCYRCPAGGPLETLLACAAGAGRIEVVRLLLDKGARRDKACCRSPLSYAAERGDLSMARLLLERGAPPNDLSSGCQGFPALSWAVQEGHAEVVRLLLEAGARPDVKVSIMGTGHGRRARQHAESRGFAEVKRLLEEAERLGPEALRARAAENAARASLEARLPAIRASERTGDAARESGKGREALAHYAAALREAPIGTPVEARLREKVFDTALPLGPEVPEQARHHAMRAQAYLSRAQDPQGYRLAIPDFEKALELAPWWADAYYNLGLVQEKSGDLAGAMRNLRFYLRAQPRSPDAEAVKKKLVELEVAKELEAGR